MTKKKQIESEQKQKRKVALFKIGLVLISIAAMSIAYFGFLDGTFYHWPKESDFSSPKGDVALIITCIALPTLLVTSFSLVPDDEDQGIFG